MKYLAILVFLLQANMNAGEFPIGIYMLAPRTADHSKTAAEAGFNYVQNYHNYSEKGRAAMREELDRAAAHGQKVLLAVYPPNSKEQEAECFAAIREFRDHPALGMWYVGDEPSGKEAHQRQLEHYRRLKKEAPKIPVALCVAWKNDYKDFADCADFLMPDYYPVITQPFPQAPLRLFTEFIHGVKRTGTLVIPITQFMSFRAYPKILEEKQLPVSEARCPNRLEMRYLIFAALAEDVSGLFFYSYYDLFKTDEMKWLSDVGKPSVAELKKFTSQIKNETFQSLTGDKGKLSDYTACKWKSADNSEEILLLINHTDREQSGPFSLATSPGQKQPYAEWGETRKVVPKIRNGKILLDTLAPWEVMVWRLR